MITLTAWSDQHLKKNVLTWDLLKSSPDWEEYVPMKYGVFFSDPEVKQHRQEMRG